MSQMMGITETSERPTAELPALNQHNDAAQLHAELVTIGNLNKLLKLTVGDASVRISLTNLEFEQLRGRGLPVRPARVTGW